MMNNIVIRDLDKKDYNKVRRYAVEGMNFRRYTERKFDLYIYSKYFLYLELSRATQILGAYINDELVGVLFADMKDEPKKIKSIWYNIYAKYLRFIVDVCYKNSDDVYNEVNYKMINEFRKNNNPDGEMIFFVVNPHIKGKGIGTILLKELETMEKGKLVYLYTDSDCTYEFYDSRGFIRESEEHIKMNIHNKEKKLTCYLYSKKL